MAIWRCTIFLILGFSVGVFADSTLLLRSSTRPITINGAEVFVQTRFAKNTITQKEAVFAIKLTDKMGRPLYIRKLDIPFQEFAESQYSNRVEAIPVIGKTGSGIALVITHYTGRIPQSTLDLLAIRTQKTGVLRQSRVILDPIVKRFPNRFVMPNTRPLYLKQDEWTYRVWTGRFYMLLPILIDWETGLVVSPKPLVMPVEVPVYTRKVGSIMVHLKPTVKSVAAMLPITPTSSLTFMQGVGIPELSTQGVQISGMGLRVDVDGRSGWMLSPEGFELLGLLSRD